MLNRRDLEYHRTDSWLTSLLRLYSKKIGFWVCPWHDLPHAVIVVIDSPSNRSSALNVSFGFSLLTIWNCAWVQQFQMAIAQWSQLKSATVRHNKSHYNWLADGCAPWLVRHASTALSNVDIKIIIIIVIFHWPPSTFRCSYQITRHLPVSCYHYPAHQWLVGGGAGYQSQDSKQHGMIFH